MGHLPQLFIHGRAMARAGLWLIVPWVALVAGSVAWAEGAAPPLQPVAQSANLGTPASQWVGWVTKVVDGDTLHVQPAQGGASQKLRIKGIDAPEVCQAWGMQSREALARLVWGQRVTVQLNDVDDHGRWLAQVFVNGEDVGARLVAQGHAWSYQFRRDPGPYAFQQQQAAINRLGLFGQPQAMRPREFRQRHGPCP
ncbi:COG1525 Micrococcal nuclease (thermonuclease) homologs [Burkholderiaceae bacterium]|jgi:endonuclease YncB( thermonuclease family)